MQAAIPDILYEAEKKNLVQVKPANAEKPTVSVDITHEELSSLKNGLLRETSKKFM